MENKKYFLFGNFSLNSLINIKLPSKAKVNKIRRNLIPKSNYPLAVLLKACLKNSMNSTQTKITK
jgi:hypothetical protein